jgi:hypothetical protein
MALLRAVIIVSIESEELLHFDLDDAVHVLMPSAAFSPRRMS